MSLIWVWINMFLFPFLMNIDEYMNLNNRWIHARLEPQKKIALIAGVAAWETFSLAATATPVCEHAVIVFPSCKMAPTKPGQAAALETRPKSTHHRIWLFRTIQLAFRRMNWATLVRSGALDDCCGLMQSSVGFLWIDCKGRELAKDEVTALIPWYDCLFIRLPR